MVEERLGFNAVGPTLAGGRPTLDQGQHGGCDLGVIPDHVGLRRTGGRIQHLGQICQRKSMTVHLHLCAVARHGT
jgi:hypothetical protein